MADPTPRLCRGCGAVIVWGITIHNKRMPLDAEPVSIEEAAAGEFRGVFTFMGDSDNIAAAGPLEPGVDIHRTHYATCPEAAKFRRSARG